MMRNLLAQLTQNEQQMHHRETRSQRALLEKLLHRDFFEIGRTGKRYDRAFVINALVIESSAYQIQSDEFALSVLDDTTALLTYRSFTIDEHGDINRQTLRTSLWVKSVEDPNEWQMRFHQGTPADDAHDKRND